jgi:hypothetical protein
MHDPNVSVSLPADGKHANGSCDGEVPKAVPESTMVNGTAEVEPLPGIPARHGNLDTPLGLTDDEAKAYTTFSRLCREKGLLDRPDSLAEDDSLDCLIDPTSLL